MVLFIGSGFSDRTRWVGKQSNRHLSSSWNADDGTLWHSIRLSSLIDSVQILEWHDQHYPGARPWLVERAPYPHHSWTTSRACVNPVSTAFQARPIVPDRGRHGRWTPFSIFIKTIPSVEFPFGLFALAFPLSRELHCIDPLESPQGSWLFSCYGSPGVTQASLTAARVV